MADGGLGGLAKKWLKAKSKELTTADRHRRDAAEYEADETARQLKDDSIAEAVLTAVPGLRRWRDQQSERAEVAEQQRVDERATELASRPVATLRLTSTGALIGEWTGTAPTRVQVVAPDESGAEDNADPFVRADCLTVDVGPLQTSAPGAETPSAWWFEVPGYHGAGTYDLAAIGMERRAADAEPEYIQWELLLGDDDDGQRFYFQPDIGPSAVTISDDLHRLDITMALTGATGDLSVRASLELSEPPAH